MKIEKPTRQFIKTDFTLKAWSDVSPYFDELLHRNIDEFAAYEKWLKDKSELDAILEEQAAWRYIRMTIDTTNKAFAEDYSFFTSKIQPELAPLEDELNRKMMASAHVETLSQQEDYRIYFRAIKKSIELYRAENVPLEAEISELTQTYGTISGGQTVKIDGEELTLQQASLKLRDQDEQVRKHVFDLISERRLQDQQQLDDLFDQLIVKRHQIALNAGYENYRDYKFDALGRFDYTQADCFDFHQAIKMHIKPLVKILQEEKAKLLKKDKLKPWDTEVDPLGREPLKPFHTGKELLDGTIEMFHKMDTYYGDCLATMEQMKHLDLESKTGKSPGGYNYPLYEIGVPFIFMNAVGSHRDLVTMIHEGGHAVHSFLSRELELTGFKSLPSEVAELASMSMELLSMSRWDEFYKDPSDFKRAKLEQLESILKILPWIAMVDEFQHWLYTNHTHTADERKAQWVAINRAYGTQMTDWTGYEDVQAYAWHRQLHIFEVPFYYIEYGIAQLGALSIWKNSKQNWDKTMKQYKEALALGYTKTIPEIYSTAGIQFNFSANHLMELAEFLQKELKQIRA